MKKLIVLIAFIIPYNLCAQNWTTEEKAVLEKVKLGWQLWEDAVNQNDLSIWLKKVPADTWTAWFLPDGGLFTFEDSKRYFEMYIKDIARYYWINITPVKIQVNGDLGYMWYYAMYAEERNDGTTVNIEQKRFAVYRKINGEWRWEAGMIDR
jgi:ketosteroid isomerase-like protein